MPASYCTIVTQTDEGNDEIPDAPTTLRLKYDFVATADDEVAAWKALLLIDRLLLWKGFERGGKGRAGKRQRAGNREIAARLTLFWTGSWTMLMDKHEDAIRPARREPKSITPERIQDLVEDGAWRRLLSALRGGAPIAGGLDALEGLMKLLPGADTASHAATVEADRRRKAAE